MNAQRFRPTSAAFLLVIASLCGGNETTRPLPSADIAPLRTALQDFASRPDSAQYNRDNSHAYVAIAPQTESAADRTYDDMYYAVLAEEVPSAPESSVASLLSRNRIFAPTFESRPPDTHQTATTP